MPVASASWRAVKMNQPRGSGDASWAGACGGVDYDAIRRDYLRCLHQLQSEEEARHDVLEANRWGQLLRMPAHPRASPLCCQFQDARNFGRAHEEARNYVLGDLTGEDAYAEMRRAYICHIQRVQNDEKAVWERARQAPPAASWETRSDMGEEVDCSGANAFGAPVAADVVSSPGRGGADTPSLRIRGTTCLLCREQLRPLLSRNGLRPPQRLSPTPSPVLLPPSLSPSPEFPLASLHAAPTAACVPLHAKKPVTSLRVSSPCAALSPAASSRHSHFSSAVSAPSAAPLSAVGVPHASLPAPDPWNVSSPNPPASLTTFSSRSSSSSLVAPSAVSPAGSGHLAAAENSTRVQGLPLFSPEECAAQSHSRKSHGASPLDSRSPASISPRQLPPLPIALSVARSAATACLSAACWASGPFASAPAWPSLASGSLSPPPPPVASSPSSSAPLSRHCESNPAGAQATPPLALLPDPQPASSRPPRPLQVSAPFRSAALFPLDLWTGRPRRACATRRSPSCVFPLPPVTSCARGVTARLAAVAARSPPCRRSRGASVENSSPDDAQPASSQIQRGASLPPPCEGTPLAAARPPPAPPSCGPRVDLRGPAAPRASRTTLASSLQETENVPASPPASQRLSSPLALPLQPSLCSAVSALSARSSLLPVAPWLSPACPSTPAPASVSESCASGSFYSCLSAPSPGAGGFLGPPSDRALSPSSVVLSAPSSLSQPLSPAPSRCAFLASSPSKSASASATVAENRAASAAASCSAAVVFPEAGEPCLHPSALLHEEGQSAHASLSVHSASPASSRAFLDASRLAPARSLRWGDEPAETRGDHRGAPLRLDDSKREANAPQPRMPSGKVAAVLACREVIRHELQTRLCQRGPARGAAGGEREAASGPFFEGEVSSHRFFLREASSGLFSEREVLEDGRGGEGRDAGVEGLHWGGCALGGGGNGALARGASADDANGEEETKGPLARETVRVEAAGAAESGENCLLRQELRPARFGDKKLGDTCRNERCAVPRPTAAFARSTGGQMPRGGRGDASAHEAGQSLPQSFRRTQALRCDSHTPARHASAEKIPRIRRPPAQTTGEGASRNGEPRDLKCFEEASPGGCGEEGDDRLPAAFLARVRGGTAARGVETRRERGMLDRGRAATLLFHRFAEIRGLIDRGGAGDRAGEGGGSKRQHEM
ncbi:hypothetical protein BESB_077870 [Besnoitia besnoiti]|uniref:Uncharacterized protein n=1 Tax=Besnoitia besnoiti TaxID=94643 RepID=A0A2A9MDV8_BESBE|nr:hypothetical protein BESB_077870 [Besnoitia besnoiti]PFH33570.1 hypothetical protein BESB_077870 [Besnoitia besnoiti]